jgi:uncharacterized damage-inducible protein DinB
VADMMEPMTLTAPEITRDKEPFVADERTMLEGWLDYHRQTLLHKCAGLTAEQLVTRSVEPSSLSLLGLVRHMAEVERWWFRRNSAGQEIGDLYCTEASPDGDFDDVDPADAPVDMTTFSTECDLARAAVADLALDHTFTHPRRGTEMSLRWVYVHMIEEYARHNGHADLIRERIDGVTGS